MSRPDFIIIGAMKSGTSTLQDQLTHQPGIFMTTPKEPNYFSDDAVFAKGPDWYGGLFAEAPEGSLKGEASTHYTKLPTYPQTISRLAAAVPNPLLIYVLRNPVERAVSHFMHEWSQGVMTPDMIAEFARHEVLAEYGCYGMQLAPYFEKFGRDSVYVTSLEQLKADPQAELTAIGHHIGAGQDLIWDFDLKAQNVSSERLRRLPFHDLLIESAVAKTLRRTLVPKSWREKIRKARSVGPRPELTDDLRHRLEQRFIEDRALLADMLPGHPALSLCYPFADKAGG